jgi:hypothetical protein
MVDALKAAGWLPARWDRAAYERLAELLVFGVVFALGWLVMIWGWGRVIGGLLGWIPAYYLANLIAPLWRLVAFTGAVTVPMLVLARIM